jgi:hypothetical protein
MEARILARSFGRSEMLVLLLFIMKGCGAIRCTFEYEASPIVGGRGGTEFLQRVPFCFGERFSGWLTCRQMPIKMCHDH